jgi:hypothetical protein
MEYLIGTILALVTAGFAKLSGFDRDGAFYPTVLIITATYYVLFAVIGASRQTLIVEAVFATVFFALAAFGFKRTMWVVIGGFIAHGVFDVVRPSFIHNPGVPRFWPGFCLAYDLALGLLLAVLLLTHSEASGTSASTFSRYPQNK